MCNPPSFQRRAIELCCYTDLKHFHSLVVVLLLGCASRPNTQTVPIVGMSEADARAIYEAQSIDSGVVYWGGSGRHRVYFQLDANTQTWLEISGPPSVVTEVGPREPKSHWTRYQGDSIVVE